MPEERYATCIGYFSFPREKRGGTLGLSGAEILRLVEEAKERGEAVKIVKVRGGFKATFKIADLEIRLIPPYNTTRETPVPIKGSFYGLRVHSKVWGALTKEEAKEKTEIVLEVLVSLIFPREMSQPSLF